MRSPTQDLKRDLTHGACPKEASGRHNSRLCGVSMVSRAFSEVTPLARQ